MLNEEQKKKLEDLKRILKSRGCETSDEALLYMEAVTADRQKAIEKLEMEVKTLETKLEELNAKTAPAILPEQPQSFLPMPDRFILTPTINFNAETHFGHVEVTNSKGNDSHNESTV